MAKKKQNERFFRQENGKTIMTFKDSGKHKMDSEELANHLHLLKTGHRAWADKTKFTRKSKHKTKFM